MDCPTNADIPLLIDESLARELLGHRFNFDNFKKMADMDGYLSRELFLLQLDHIDVYISHDRSSSHQAAIQNINASLIQRGLCTILEEGMQVEVRADQSCN